MPDNPQSLGPVQPLKILFLCVANSARSQIAEGIAKNLFKGKAEIQSAGSRPSGSVHTWAIKTLEKDGIDLSRNWSKSIDDLPPEFVINLDYIITLCAEESCPFIETRARRIHWPIPDPAAANSEDEKAEAFLQTKIEIRNRLRGFGEKLGLL